MAREISEHDATLAVDAAAKKVYEGLAVVGMPDWDDVPMIDKHNLKAQILPLVWAALGALPDQRHTAWLEGYVAADNGRDIETNPYPAEEA